jgi:hypothetical protein
MPATVQQETLEEQIKKAVAKLHPPDIPGIDFERHILPREMPQLDPHTTIYCPFGQKTLQGKFYTPADKHKNAVENIAKPGLIDDFLLMASVRKLSENYRAAVGIGFYPYLDEGVEEELIRQHGKIEAEQNKDKKTKLIQDIQQKVNQANVKKYKTNIEGILKGVDHAFTQYRVPAFVTPPPLAGLYKSRNLQPDPGRFNDLGAIEHMVDKFGDNYDKENFADGTRIYVKRYVLVKTPEGKDARAPIIEVWKKKEK